MRQCLLATAALLLAACGSNPNIIEPSPLPELDPEYRVERLWSTHTGEGIGQAWLRLQPAVTERSVFAVDLHGRVTALDRETGKYRWQRDTGYAIAGGVHAAYGLVLFGTRDGEVVALSTEDGEQRWQATLSSEVLSAPNADGQRVVAQTIDGNAVALDIETGEQLWSFEANVPVLTLRGTSRPVFHNGRVLVAFASGKVAALESDSGVPAWEQQVAEPTGRSELDRLVDVDNNLIAEGGGIFVSSFQGKLAVLDENSGQPFWDRDMSSYTAMDASGGVLFLSDDESEIHAVNQRSGDTLWRQDKLRGRRLVGVVIHRGLAVTGDSDGYLHWLDTVDGRPLARTRHDRDGFAGAPVVHDKVLYALSRDGRVAAYVLEARD